VANGVAVDAGVFMEEGFAAFASNEIEEDASEHGADAGGCGVERHARWIADAEIDQQQIINDRKAEYGRIQK